MVRTGPPHSHSLTGFEPVDGSGRLHFPPLVPSGPLRGPNLARGGCGWRLRCRCTIIQMCVLQSNDTVQKYACSLLETEGGFSLQEMDFFICHCWPNFFLYSKNF